MEAKKKRAPNAEWLKKDPKLIWIETWDELLNALAVTHTMSLGDICEYLMIKRDWVNTHIRHNVPHIFIQGAKNKSGKCVDWRLVANWDNRTRDRELVWFNPAEVYDFLNEHIDSFTRQTIVVNVAQFLSYEQIVELYELYAKLVGMAKEKVGGGGFWLHKQVLDDLMRADGGFYSRLAELLPPPVRVLGSFRVDAARRGGIPHVSVEKPAELFGKIKIRAIRDEIGYSGTDESVRRRFCRAGYSKIELGIAGKDEKIGRLIFFVDYKNRRLEGKYADALAALLAGDKAVPNKDEIGSFMELLSGAGDERVSMNWTVRFDKYQELLEPCFSDLVKFTNSKKGWL